MLGTYCTGATVFAASIIPLISVMTSSTAEDEFGILGPYAASIGKRLGGYWSVDFALSQDGIWYLIDMAVGERSWHPEHTKQ